MVVPFRGFMKRKLIAFVILAASSCGYAVTKDKMSP